jgi:mRNA interferase RelE/StbE
MDKFQIVLSPHAIKDFDGFSDGVCGKIVRTLQILKDNPFPRGKAIKKIKGTNSDYYRLRVDKYRVFYMIEGNRAIVLRILNKKDVERFIRNLS